MMIKAPPKLPDDLSWRWHLRLWMVVLLLAATCGGVAVGLFLGQHANVEAEKLLQETQKNLQAQFLENGYLKRRLLAVESQGAGHGFLKEEDRKRHELQGKAYVAAMRSRYAQSAADLMTWFLERWNELLDSPQPDDRVGRRATALTLLIGGMADNIPPKDYVPWQAEFLSNNWLAEIHMDKDANGLPASRFQRNTYDSFAGSSICTIAMALNQAVNDAQILVMPDLRCDRITSKISLFLQGETLDEAIGYFIQEVRKMGFIVLERYEKNVRLVLLGKRQSSVIIKP